VLTAAVVAGALGFALYFACPAVGPHQAFGPPYPNAWPPAPSGAPLITAALDAPRNGMPSLHTVWALLIWFNAQARPVAVRRTLRLFVIMTLWAAMGLEEHWLMDIIVAVPLAVAIQFALVPDAPGGRRWAEVVGCGMMTAVWLIGFRMANPLLALPMVAAWAAVVATVWWPLSRQRAASLALRIFDSANIDIARNHPLPVLVNR
jgi:hypothetical protein